MFTAFGFPAQPYERILFCQARSLCVKVPSLYCRDEMAVQHFVVCTLFVDWRFLRRSICSLAFLAPQYLFIGVSCAAVSVLSENV